MKYRLPDRLLSGLSEFVAARLALHFPAPLWDDLERGVRSASGNRASRTRNRTSSGCSSAATSEDMEVLAGHLTVGETYFWREPQVFDALEERILPELIRSRGSGEKRLRIWSAGCSTGEEPYSIAMALRRTLPAIDDWNIAILATDLNPRMLRRAAAGRYSEWSFRNAPPWLKDLFFRPIGAEGRREIIPEVRKMVSFAHLNLAEDGFPSAGNGTNAIDIIFCRNVLMYLSPESANRIVRKLHCALVDGGWLMTGAGELSQTLFSSFAAVQFPGAIVYRKPSEPPRTEEPASSDMPVPGSPRFAKPPNLPALGRSKVRAARKEPGEEAPRASAPSVRKLADLGELSEALAACEKAIAGG